MPEPLPPLLRFLSSPPVSRCLLFPSLFVCLWVNSLRGAVAWGQLMAGVVRDRGMRNACELERRRVGGRGAEVALGISALVSCQQAQS